MEDFCRIIFYSVPLSRERKKIIVFIFLEIFAELTEKKTVVKDTYLDVHVYIRPSLADVSITHLVSVLAQLEQIPVCDVSRMKTSYERAT